MQPYEHGWNHLRRLQCFHPGVDGLSSFEAVVHLVHMALRGEGGYAGKVVERITYFHDVRISRTGRRLSVKLGWLPL